ncbi:MAG: MMPL family transporter [Pseudomonadota bacterium]|nr:MMPL family transporter [Pseudomonadota bacterium]
MRGVKPITENPKTTLAAILLLLAACVPGLLQLRADTSISPFLPRGHASYQQKLDIQRIYNINDSLFIDVFQEGGDIFTPQGLAVVRSVSRFLEDLPGIRPGSVRSLDSREDIRGSEGGFDVVPFLEPMPATPEQARAVRDRLKAFPLYDGLLVSADGTRAGVVADFEDSADVLFVFAELEKLRRRIAGETDFAIQVSGPPIVTGTLNVYLNRDALRLDPVSAALASLLLFLALRTLWGVLLPLAVVIPASIVAFASMPLMGFPFTPFSNAVPVVVLATSIADAVHFLSDYYDRRLEQPELSARQAVERTLRELWQPIVITSVTTAAGFLMLIQGSPMLPTSQFGVTAAIGVLAAMIFSLTALPAAVAMADARPSAAFARLYATRAGGGPGAWDRLVARLMGRLIGNSRVAGGFLLAVAIAGIAGTSRLYPDHEPVTFFPRDSHVARDFHSVREHYLGVNFVEVDIDTGVGDGIYDPDFLRRLDGLQARIEAWGGVGGTLAITDYLKKLNQALHADQADFYRIADSAEANAQLFLLYDMAGDPRRFDEVADGARQRANLRILLKAGNYARSADFVRWLEAQAAATFPQARVRLGGETYVIHNWMSHIGVDVGVSIFLTALCMGVIGVLFLRSVTGGILLLAPIAVGVFLTYAFIGAADVPVGLGTSSFAAIAIGVGVDFAIHYLWRYRHGRRRGLTHEAATRRVMEGVGKAILFNGLIVIGGFSVLTLATTLPPRQVGIYVAISVAGSLATTFLVLSVATRWWRVAMLPLAAAKYGEAG